MKDGKRKIKFDKSFAQRVLHAGYQNLSLGRNDVEFLFVKTARVKISILENLWNILYLKSRKDAENIKKASRTRDLHVSPVAAKHVIGSLCLLYANRLKQLKGGCILLYGILSQRQYVRDQLMERFSRECR